MAKDYVYFDLETQRTANDSGGWGRKCNMGMSIGVTYSTAAGEYRIYGEKEVHELIAQLQKADLVIGFNTLDFDYQVLMGYTTLDLTYSLRSLDLLQVITATLGHRVGLDSVAGATLGIGKTADGLDALRWWREGRVMEIAEYCCYDVKCTKLVHEYGMKNRELFYLDRFQQRKKLAVAWT